MKLKFLFRAWPCVATTLFLSSCATQQPPASSAYYQNFAGTIGIDRTGIRHLSSDYPRGKVPWKADVVMGVGPEYSYRDRAARHQGTGVFHMLINLKSGTVTNVIVARSTGFQSLDESVVTAFRQWRWHPNRWREIDLPVTFVLTEPVGAADAVPLAHQSRAVKVRLNWLADFSPFCRRTP